MHDHSDTLEPINQSLSLQDKLVEVHKVVKEYLPFVTRIAIAVYDPKTQLLKTFLHSSGKDDPLPHYQALMSDAPSLEKVRNQRRPRVINNMRTFATDTREHCRKLGRQGYAASYTLPMFWNGEFFGFVFFNSYDPDVFSEKALRELDIFGHMVSLMVINELTVARTLVAAVTTTGYITHLRDPETGSHLDRMSRYARLIATALAPRFSLNDDYIEHIFMYSPLHDIGKIAIPDRILLKPGSLDSIETEIMRTHPRKGREIIDEVLFSFGLESVDHADILRNIAEYHHETMNGKGYPNGLQGSNIPLEARIVAVADVFDALTSQRPYKDAWSNEAAFEWLQRRAGENFDADCVAALIENRHEVERIQAQFKEERLG